jgi:hypothetical protein
MGNIWRSCRRRELRRGRRGSCRFYRRGRGGGPCGYVKELLMCIYVEGRTNDLRAVDNAYIFCVELNVYLCMFVDY